MNVGRNSRLRVFLFSVTLFASTWLAVASCRAQAQPQSANQDSHAPDVTEAARPASAPTVIYEHGELTVTAEDVPLSEVMSLVHQVTGAQVDLPAEASGQRIWAKLGPGPARKVLADLFSNTDLNYIIQGSTHDASGVESVTLSIRDNSPGNGDTAASAARSNGGAAEIAEPEAQPAKEAAANLPPAPTSTPAPEAPSVPTAMTSTQITSESGQASIARPVTMPAPMPSSFNTDALVQQLSNMYQQRSQMQQPTSPSKPASN